MERERSEERRGEERENLLKGWGLVLHALAKGPAWGLGHQPYLQVYREGLLMYGFHANPDTYPITKLYVPAQGQ